MHRRFPDSRSKGRPRIRASDREFLTGKKGYALKALQRQLDELHEQLGKKIKVQGRILDLARQSYGTVEGEVLAKKLLSELRSFNPQSRPRIAPRHSKNLQRIGAMPNVVAAFTPPYTWAWGQVWGYCTDSEVFYGPNSYPSSAYEQIGADLSQQSAVPYAGCQCITGIMQIYTPEETQWLNVTAQAFVEGVAYTAAPFFYGEACAGSGLSVWVYDMTSNISWGPATNWIYNHCETGWYDGPNNYSSEYSSSMFVPFTAGHEYELWGYLQQWAQVWGAADAVSNFWPTVDAIILS